jgi:antitoxin component YwqK of YwqJK toxin-antitoxin module
MKIKLEDSNLETEEIRPGPGEGVEYLYRYKGSLFNGIITDDNIEDENGDIKHMIFKDGHHIRNERYLKDKLIFECDLILLEEHPYSKTISRVVNGLVREWYDNGQLKYEKNFVEGLPNGKCKEWYDNGQFKYQGIKKKNVKFKEFSDGTSGNVYEDTCDGECNWWRENGKLFRQEIWKDGEQISDISYFDNGEIESKNDGNIEQKFYESGNMKSEARSIKEGFSTFTFGSHIRETERKEWDDSGNLILHGRKYELNEEYTITEEWYNSLKRKSITLTPINNDISFNITWDEDGNEMKERTRIRLGRCENTLEDIDSGDYVKEVFYHVEFESTKDSYEDDEDCDWGQYDRIEFLSYYICDDGKISEINDENWEQVDCDEEDYYDIEEFKSLFLYDVKEYGNQLEKIINVDEVIKEIKEIIDESNPLKQELFEYLKI